MSAWTCQIPLVHVTGETLTLADPQRVVFISLSLRAHLDQFYSTTANGARKHIHNAQPWLNTYSACATADN
eukprot:11219563-Lingulodinium_polyedra.AAC.1